MPKFFVAKEAIQGKEIEIKGEDINHIKNVLRKKEGAQITIGNKDNLIEYLCEITTIENEVIKCNILETLENNTESNIQVSIFQGIPKADKMEFIIQKAVELGCYDITPVEMKRSVVKFQEKDKKRKLERWQKISEVAAKQSGRNRIPKIDTIKNIKEICNLCYQYDIVIVAYEQEKQNKLKYEIEKLKKMITNKDVKTEQTVIDIKIAILIGPEGGIDETEIEKLKENGAKIVTLGNRILRTETVALNILSIIMYELEE